MQLFHFYHHHHNLRNLFASDFWLFELSILLHVIARSLINIFIPVLLLQNGFSLNAVLMYYFIYHAIDIPLNFLAGDLVRRIGARWVIVLSNFAIIGFFLYFNILEPGNFLLLAVLASIAAVYDSFYWVSHLYLFIKSTDGNKDAGGKTGSLYSAKKVATMIGPIAGAFILTYSTQSLLITVSIILFFISIVPLFYVDEFPDKPTKWDNVMSFFSFFRSPVEKNNFISSGLFGVHMMSELILWPLFIYIAFETLNSIAFVPVLIAGTTIIFSMFNKRITATTRENMIMVGALALSLLWFARLGISWEPFYYISIVIVGIFSLFVGIPLDSNLFIRAKTTDPLKTAVYRNTASMSTRAVVLGIVAIFANVFNAAFIATAIALLLLAFVNYYFMNEDQEEFDAIIG